MEAPIQWKHLFSGSTYSMEAPIQWKADTPIIHTGIFNYSNDDDKVIVLSKRFFFFK
ncbi:hypothetical protein HYPBUDRAFT_218982 [Hyphopichia burtonii NRRL Y-1933]|uniref:Uncharacterized protein n=1 Tax=Hyphopichia burtonii NRRL Y-1933 TaxID=984485 RepID=A0A1E4RFA4_9ASCO|nr:hypothetical protein HYPBUDRAFT_218982 [Hyphopichia burtonii NRRL Y-1933]ODV65923.1 hypothetical protein HYPBUDRAFT_218982 [Hyphopichia burtonii NRRL Y-1933]